MSWVTPRALVQATGIDQLRAEVLVHAAGENLVAEPRAFEILTDIVEQTQPGNPTLADNPSEVSGTGILIGQAAFTYSHLIYREKLAIGANARIMTGRTYNRGTRVADLDGDDDFQDLIEPTDTSTEIELGLDLGLMYRPTPRWSLGLVADNINKPSFDLAGNEGTIKLEPLLRAGAAFRPIRWFNAALDVDLNEVDSGVVNGLGYRYANFGAEFLVGRWFAGRVGAYKNVGASRSSVIYTGWGQLRRPALLGRSGPLARRRSEPASNRVSPARCPRDSRLPSSSTGGRRPGSSRSGPSSQVLSAGSLIVLWSLARGTGTRWGLVLVWVLVTVVFDPLGASM